MSKDELLKVIRDKIEQHGLYSVARESGISAGHLHHIVYKPEIYPLTKRMEEKLRKVVDGNKKEVVA